MFLLRPILKIQEYLNLIIMKNIGITILLTAIIQVGVNQSLLAEIQSEVADNKSVNTDRNTKVAIGANLVSVEGNDSSLNLRVGNRGLKMLESLEGPKFKFEKYTENSNQDKEDKEAEHPRKRDRFKGHWTGIEFGFNSYLTSDNSLVMPDDINFMTLHSDKSSNFNLNFSQLSLGLTRHVGFVTGLGLNWNNYRFDGSNNIQKGTNGIIEILDPGVSLEKSKLATLYLNIPFIMEIQIPDGNRHFVLAAGPIWAVKLGSHNKMVYQDGVKVKSDGDFSLNMHRLGATARIGNENFHIYGTYYKTPLFMTGKGPGGYDLYPFEVGIALSFNN
jgi:hypothetical protein